MKTVEIEESGVLEDEEKAHFGGTYSLWERLKMGGTGSSKIVYESGIDHFDQLDRGIANELGFVSFEILKNGLILRLNRNQRLRCVGVRLSELEQIRLVAFRIELRYRRFNGYRTKIVHRGELELLEVDGTSSRFSIFTQNFESLLQYFNRKELVSKLHYSISELPPEKDYSNLLDFLGEL